MKDENMEKDYIINRLSKEVVEYQEQIKKLKSEIMAEEKLNNSYGKYEEKTKYINYNQDFKKSEYQPKKQNKVDNSDSFKVDYNEHYGHNKNIDKDYGK